LDEWGWAHLWDQGKIAPEKRFCPGGYQKDNAGQFVKKPSQERKRKNVGVWLVIKASNPD